MLAIRQAEDDAMRWLDGLRAALEPYPWAYTLLVLAALLLLAWRLGRVPALQPQRRWLAGLALLQLVTGLSNVVLGWPLLAAVLHTGGAAALALVLTWTLCASRAAPVSLAPAGANRVPA